METYAWQLGLGVISVLGAINAFFISRLVKKIDSSSQEVVNAHQQITEMKTQLMYINEKVGQMSDLYSRMSSVEKQLAVISYAIRQPTHREEPLVL